MDHRKIRHSWMSSFFVRRASFLKELQGCFEKISRCITGKYAILEWADFSLDKRNFRRNYKGVLRKFHDGSPRNMPSLNVQIFRQTSEFFDGIRGYFEKISRCITGKYAILEWADFSSDERVFWRNTRGGYTKLKVGIFLKRSEIFDGIRGYF